MKTYEATMKMKPVYGREGAGRSETVKVEAGSWATAAARAIKQFPGKLPNRVHRTMTIELVRVI